MPDDEATINGVKPLLPTRPKVAAGVVEPMPIFPLAKMVNSELVVETEKRLVTPVAVVDAIDSSAVGVEVPIPTLPTEVILIFSVSVPPSDVVNPRSVLFPVLRIESIALLDTLVA